MSKERPHSSERTIQDLKEELAILKKAIEWRRCVNYWM